MEERRLWRALMLLLLLLVAATAATAEDGIAYKAHIEGVPDTGLRRLLEQSSALITKVHDKVPSRSALQRRAQMDEDDLAKVLQSEGYYNGIVHIGFSEDKDPVEAVIYVDLGTRFTIDSFDIQYTDEVNAPAPALVTQDGILLKQGVPARAEDILSAKARMLNVLRASGYPLADVGQEIYEVDRIRETMVVRWRINHNGSWRFGPLSIEGAPNVDQGFIARKKTWTDGDFYDSSLVGGYQRALQDTGLFSGVRLLPDRDQAKDGLLPVDLRLQERQPRSIALGGTYSTNEGPGLQISWQHRNLFHRARQLNISLNLATIRQQLDVNYRSPEFHRSDQTFILGMTVKHEDNDAYKEKSVNVSGGVERQINPHLKISAALAPEVSQIDDAQGHHTTELLNFPLVAIYDNSDDLLDPTRGVRAKLIVTPSAGNYSGPVSFVSIEGIAATYFKVIKAPTVVLGLRTRLGVIVGEDSDDIPATHRFFAGGGGSIRGYGYKKVGPRFDNGDPAGGRTVNEFGAELRFKVTNSIGLVPFIEAGNVYDGSFDSIGSDLRVGAGLGIRYYTAIGPLRLDVGVPLNRQQDDDAVQIYVSIGQAF